MEKKIIYLYIILLIGATFNMTDLYAEELLIDQNIVGEPLEIVKMGHPILREKAKPVDDPTSQETQQTAANIMATINKIGADTVAGLAAPQVNIPLQILIFQVPEKKANDNEEKSSFTVVINPKIEYFSEEKDLGWEGCLSIPELVGEVARAKHIKYSYSNLKGKRITKEAFDFHARVIQHEIDHLNGFVYLERMDNMKQLYFNDEFQEYVLKPLKEMQENQ